MAQNRTIISCGIYLFRSDNKLLVGHPTGFKPNVWAIPKGRMALDEDNHFNVAKRELIEETGIDINNYQVIKFEELPMVRYKETNKYLKGFFIKVNSDFSDITLKCDSMVYRNGLPSFPEFDDFKWVTIEESMTMLHDFQINNLYKCIELTNERIMIHLESFKMYEK